MGMDDVEYIISRQSVVHSAAKTGNAHIIKMVIKKFPNQSWVMDGERRTFMHRRDNILQLAPDQATMKRFILMSTDEQGNNILHLAAKLCTQRLNTHPVYSLRKETDWFKMIKENVSVECREMRNMNGDTPHQIFQKEHHELLDQSVAWAQKTAGGCLLIVTLLFGVVLGVLLYYARRI